MVAIDFDAKFIPTCIYAKLNRKFYTVKNWYQFPPAREKLVSILIFRTRNISHFVKNTHEVKHIAYMRISHIDKIPLICFILHSIPIIHTIVTDICDDYVPVLHICDNLVPIFHMCEYLVPVLHSCEF